MQIRDTNLGWGLMSRLLHWIIAGLIVALFALGVWMVELNYTSPYYNLAPEIHKSVGMLVLFAMAARVVWRAVNVTPSLDNVSRTERIGSSFVHWGFYLVIFAVLISGYVISTADGRSIDMFGLFSVPSLMELQGIETSSGRIHELLAYVTILLAIIHTLAALKHHYVDRNDILRRMWSGPRTKS